MVKIKIDSLKKRTGRKPVPFYFIDPKLKPKANNKFVRIDGRRVATKASELDIAKSNHHLNPFLNKKTMELSGGERRLVKILLTIHSEAKYILIDVPFNGIAQVNKEDVKSLIKEHSRRKGFVITDHDHRSVSDIATKIILLHIGSTREIEATEDLTYRGYLPGMHCATMKFSIVNFG